MLSLKAPPSRTAVAVGVGLVLVAGASVLFVLLGDRTERIVAAAAIWAAAALLLVPLALRVHRRERGRQSELERSEARYRALMDGLPLATWLTKFGNRDSTLHVSSSIEGLTGYSPGEWMEQPGLFSKLLHPDDRDRVE